MSGLRCRKARRQGAWDGSRGGRSTHDHPPRTARTGPTAAHAPSSSCSLRAQQCRWHACIDLAPSLRLRAVALAGCVGAWREGWRRAPVPQSAVAGGTAARRTWGSARTPHRVPAGGTCFAAPKPEGNPPAAPIDCRRIGTEARRQPPARPQPQVATNRRKKAGHRARPRASPMEPAIRSWVSRPPPPAEGGRRARRAPSAHCRLHGSRTSGSAGSRPDAPGSAGRAR